MKINSKRSEIQTLQNLYFEFQIVDIRKSDKTISCIDKTCSSDKKQPATIISRGF